MRELLVQLFRVRPQVARVLQGRLSTLLDHSSLTASYVPKDGGGWNGPLRCAIFAAMERRAGSLQRRPTSCTPIGRPSLVERVSGSTTTGLPVRLKGQV